MFLQTYQSIVFLNAILIGYSFIHLHNIKFFSTADITSVKTGIKRNAIIREQRQVLNLNHTYTDKDTDTDTDIRVKAIANTITYAVIDKLYDDELWDDGEVAWDFMINHMIKIEKQKNRKREKQKKRKIEKEKNRKIEKQKNRKREKRKKQ